MALPQPNHVSAWSGRMKRIYGPKQRFGSRLRRAQTINRAGAKWPGPQAGVGGGSEDSGRPRPRFRPVGGERGD